MTTEVVTTNGGTLPDAVERLLIEGDLGRLTPEQRILYYRETCHSLGLNPLTRPFDYLRLSGKLVLYAKKDCTDQLRKIHGVSIEDLQDEVIGDIYRVKAKARDRSNRTDFAVGAVNVKGVQGEALANAYMKAETKSKRRVTLSICGLGMLDESEVDSIPGAERVAAEVVEAPPEKPTDEQLADLDTLIENTGADKDKLLSFFKVKALSDLSPQDYKSARRMLDAKLAKAK